MKYSESPELCLPASSNLYCTFGIDIYKANRIAYNNTLYYAIDCKDLSTGNVKSKKVTLRKTVSY